MPRQSSGHLKTINNWAHNSKQMVLYLHTFQRPTVHQDITATRIGSAGYSIHERSVNNEENLVGNEFYCKLGDTDTASRYNSVCNYWYARGMSHQNAVSSWVEFRCSAGCGGPCRQAVWRSRQLTSAHLRPRIAFVRYGRASTAEPTSCVTICQVFRAFKTALV